MTARKKKTTLSPINRRAPRASVAKAARALSYRNVILSGAQRSRRICDYFRVYSALKNSEMLRQAQHDSKENGADVSAINRGAPVASVAKAARTLSYPTVILSRAQRSRSRNAADRVGEAGLSICDYFGVCSGQKKSEMLRQAQHDSKKNGDDVFTNRSSCSRPRR